MKCLCKMDCCKNCPNLKICGGCDKCKGKPLGGKCLAYKIIAKDGFKKYENYVLKTVEEVNGLNIKGLKVDNLNLVIGAYLNMEYKLPNKQKIKFLEDNNIYLATQIETSNGKCFGVAVDEKYILVARYGENGKNAELVCYKRR